MPERRLQGRPDGRIGSATAAGPKRLDDSFQTDLDIGGGLSALLGLAGRSSLQGAIELSPAADGSRPRPAGHENQKRPFVACYGK
jgi:hypothetical protein